ncbi:MAG TPA: PQQ-binding-like beta-propeller repeat protein [Blastocatellia bacterium]|nr:PQQ-binding-like beta-propeller repeat protein [Blastocatellia bacterium]
MPLKISISLLVVLSIASLAFVSIVSGQSPSETPGEVEWVAAVNCTITGTTLSKTSGNNEIADAGARSRQSIASGDGYAEFTATQTNKLRFCGLTNEPTGLDFVGIDFAIKLTDFGVAEVRENNVYRAEVPYQTGDVFRISVSGGVIRYSKNGAVFQSSLGAPAYPLVLQAVLISVGASIEKAALGAGSVTEHGEWTMYLHDPAHTSYCAESSLNTSNIPNLSEAWRFNTAGLISGTPVVSGGAVYVGSWDGNMYALREETGELLWKFNAGTIRVDACNTSYGIDNTAAIADGKLFFAAADCTLYALNPATGSLIWKTQLANPLEAFHAFASPVVVDGKLYLGLASHCVNPCVRGRVVCVDIRDGRVLWSFIAAPENSTGGGVWSSVAVDSTRRLVYVGTGNFCTGDDTYSNAIVALNADTGTLAWTFKKLVRDNRNLDFGASPVLLDINGRAALVIGSKDGHCYALDRTTGSLLWDSPVTDPNTVGGIISSPAAAYGLVFMGSSVNGSTSGQVVALDQSNGHIVWQLPQSKQVFGPASATGGAVFIGGLDGVLRAYDGRTGSVLWSAQMAPIYGGVAISQDRIFVGSADNSIRSFKVNPVVDPPPSAPATVQVLSPNTKVKLKAGSSATISWSSSGAGVEAQDVSFSQDGGQTWEEVASGLAPGATSYEWTVPAIKTKKGRIRVSLMANGSAVAQDASDVNFIIKKKN